MKKLNDRLENNHSAFRPLNRRLSNANCKVVPPTRFVACRLACGLKEICGKLCKANNPPFEDKAQQFGLASQSTPARKLAGRYKVEQLIGQGQSSIIVAAEDLYHSSKKIVAVKIMNLDYTMLGIQEADCIQELNRADPLNATKIVRLLNKFLFQDHFCMVFELLRPRPLHQYFQDSCFNSEEEKLEKISEVAVQVLGVLSFLRRENVIHADLKPENILLESGGRLKVKVVDFGNAIRWIHREMSLYYDNFELQTLLYRAPEVIFGVPFGPEIDMWSLGCILAELYLGKPIFVGKDKTEVLQEIVSTLGPLPRIPFQSGKFYSDFAVFLNSKTGSDPILTETRLMKKLNNLKNFTFANFLSGLLQYNPNERFTPVQAISHPFLAAHVPFREFLSNSTSGSEDFQGLSRSGVLLTSANYPHRPYVADDIRRQHLSAIDLLYVGTKGETSSPTRSTTPPVGRVAPLVCEKLTDAKIKATSSVSSSRSQLAAESTGKCREKNTLFDVDALDVAKMLLKKDQLTIREKQFWPASEHENKTNRITEKRKHTRTAEAAEDTSTQHCPDQGASSCTTARTRGHFQAKKMKHNHKVSELEKTSQKPSTSSVNKSQLIMREDLGKSITLNPRASHSHEKRTASRTQHRLEKKKPKDVEEEKPAREDKQPQLDARRSLKLNENVDYDVLLL